MDSFEHRVMRESLAGQLQQRRTMLLLVAWPFALIFPIVCLVAYNARPMEAYTAVGMVALSLVFFALLILAHVSRELSTYRIATIWVAVLMIFACAQTANILFGATEGVYLNGQPPLLVASYQMIVVFSFCVLEHRIARQLTWIFSAVLFVLVVTHSLLRIDQFASHYAQTIMLIMVMFGVPGVIVLMRVHFSVHVNAVHAATVKLQEDLDRRSLLATDSVTGALNRDSLQENLRRALRTDEAFGLLAFKMHNQDGVHDELGAVEFENLLREIANIIRGCFDDGVNMARRESSEIILWSRRFRELADLEDAVHKVLTALDEAKLPGWDRTQMGFIAGGMLRESFSDPMLLLDELLFRVFLAQVRAEPFCLSNDATESDLQGRR